MLISHLLIDLSLLGATVAGAQQSPDTLHLTGLGVVKYPPVAGYKEEQRILVRGTKENGGCRFSTPAPLRSGWVEWVAAYDLNNCVQVRALGPSSVAPTQELLQRQGYAHRSTTRAKQIDPRFKAGDSAQLRDWPRVRESIRRRDSIRLQEFIRRRDSIRLRNSVTVRDSVKRKP